METAKKPKAKIKGQDGNVFNILGIASRALKNNGQSDKASEMKNKVFASKSYDEALCIMADYVDFH